MRSRSLVALAIAVTVVPALAQAAESAAEDPGETPVSQDLRESVREVGNRARAHSTRLGLRPATLPAPAATISAMRRQQRRLREVVAFLSGREEIALPVDRRPAPRALPRGRDLETSVAYEHHRATRLALRLGLEQPGPLAPEAGPADRRNELARWTAIARWLSARAERVTEDERPMSERVPHYEELTCIADHESGGRWDISTGNGYYGGLQMDRQFQQTYAPDLYEAKGTADDWTQEEQMRAAAGAVEERGFTPWPMAARMCGLL